MNSDYMEPQEQRSSSTLLSAPPGSRRERLRSFARSTTQVLRQEINKYYARSDDNGTATPISSRSASPSILDPFGIPRQLTISSTSTMSFTEGQQDNLNPQCLLFPTYATRALDEHGAPVWKIRLAGWTFANTESGRLRKWALTAIRTYGGVSADSAEGEHFARSSRQFQCKTLRGVDIQIYVAGLIPADEALRPPPSNHLHHHHHLHHNPFHLFQHRENEFIPPDNTLKTVWINSGPTGRFEHTILLNTALTDTQDKRRHVLRLDAAFDNGLDASPHDGFVDLIDPTGLSIISDIDDTIKVTGVLDGRDAIIRNTFFRTATQFPGMSQVYSSWANQGAHVHYVSNSPWQVYPALSEFIRGNNFPAGSMHLRVVSTSDLIRKKPGQHKIDVITQILQDFPHRRFILIGDSGERDPEIYRMIYEQYPDQIIKIFIHDVTSERAKLADRRESLRSDSYYNTLRNYLSRDQTLNWRRPTPSSSSSSSSVMNAIEEVEVPEDQKQVMDPDVPLKTKLDMFHERMDNVTRGLPPGLLTVFTLASQLRTDPVVNKALAMFGTPR